MPFPVMAPIITGRANDFPTIVGDAKTDGTSIGDNDHDIDMPDNVLSGDCVIIGITVRGLTNHVINTPANWTQVAQPTLGTDDDDVRLGVFRRTATGPMTTVNFTFGGNVDFLSVAYCIRNWSAVAGVGSTSVGAQPDPANLTSGFGSRKCLWLPFVAWRANSDLGAPLAPANYSNVRGIRFAGGSGSKRGVSSARRFLKAASENPGPFVLDGTPSGAAMVNVAILGV